MIVVFPAVNSLKKNKEPYQSLLQVDRLIFRKIIEADETLIGYDYCSVFKGKKFDVGSSIVTTIIDPNIVRLLVLYASNVGDLILFMIAFQT